MTENVVEFIKTYLTDIVSVGSAAGFLLVGIGSLLGYAISKVQGLFDK